jgi:hypothetical protein
MSDRPSASFISLPLSPGRAPALPVQSAAPSTLDEERMRALARVIEAEIVPRLLVSLAASNHARASSGYPNPLPGSEDVDELARLLLAHECEVACAFVQILRQRGTPAERICLDLLAPVARRLGKLWEQDVCDFKEFTLGLERLHRVLQEVSGEQ